MKKTLYPELEIISKRKEGMLVKDIMEMYHIKTSKSYYDIIKRNGREHIIGNKKYDVDDTYFENIDTEDRAYWLGFLYADGYVRLNKGRSGELTIKLKNSELYHLELFNRYLKSNYPIKKDVVSKVIKNGKEYISLVCFLRICNTKIVKDLMKIGCTNAKSSTIRLPELRDNLMCHFIRGYFDGDGCLYKDINRPNSFQISIISNELFIDDMMKILKLGKKNNRGNYSVLQIWRIEDITNFKQYIYENSKIYLQRKKDKFDLIIHN